MTFAYTPHLCVAALSVLAGSTLAQTVIEAESDGQAANNTLANAQQLAPGAFSTNNSSTVFGSLPTARVQGRSSASDVDFFRFSMPAGLAYFDIDAAGPGLDTYLALFDSSGTLLADSDDSFPADPGSASDFDAFLGGIQLNAGTYFIAVAVSGNFANATFTGATPAELTRPDGAFGGFAFPGASTADSSFAVSGQQSSSLPYTLSVTIPAPGAAAALALAGMVGLRRRSRRA